MPELPEVENVRLSLSKVLLKRKINKVEVLRRDSIEYPTAAKFPKLASGHTFKSIDRRGKYLLFHLDDDAGLVAHLRMSGRFLYLKTGKISNKYVRVAFHLDNNHSLLFEDTRVFGRIWYKAAGQTFADVAPTLGELGPEPLSDLSAKYLQQAFKNRRQAIKTTLLDQRLIAGIGNIYADECLFLSNIHPQTAAGSLSLKKLDKLCTNIVQVLQAGIDNGGSTLRNYTNIEGVNGNYQNEAWVYGRDGSPCRVCRKPIIRIKLGGRSAHYCAQCQTSSRT